MDMLGVMLSEGTDRCKSSAQCKADSGNAQCNAEKGRDQAYSLCSV